VENDVDATGLQHATAYLVDVSLFPLRRLTIYSPHPVLNHIVEELAITSISSHAADIASTGPVAFTTPEKPEGSDINNIVLAILELLRSYPHVLYIDIDCHYGGCVDEAFYTKDRVTTCCFHEFGECFLGIGTQEDKGPPSQGKGYAINVHLKDGSMDETYISFFESVIPRTLFVCLYIYLSLARC
jgi:acetoin utilization deacetylase AcuC-like enzyme